MEGKHMSAGPVARGDALLEQYWGQRRWGSFISMWLIVTVLISISTFVLPLVGAVVGASIINVISLIFGLKGIAYTYHDVYEFSWRFALLNGSASLLLTPFAMVFKEIRGGPKK
jgi:hypothetical protein